MSKLQPLRDLVTERLTAAAEEIFALVEKTIAEYEEELCRAQNENKRKQELLDAVLNPKVLLPEAQAPSLSVSSADPDLDPETTTAQIKEEPEELCILELEEVPLPRILPDTIAGSVKPEESPLLGHTEPEKKTQEDISDEPHFYSETEDTEQSSEADNEDDWINMEIETEDEDKQVQNKYRRSAAQNTEEKQEERIYKKSVRYKEVTPEELNDLEDETNELDTKRNTKWAVRIFRDFLIQKKMDIYFESYTAQTLNEALRLFYASVQSTKETGEYSISSLNSLRSGINRHLTDVNIINDHVFKSSNAVFRGIVKRQRKNLKDSLHHPRIPESDLQLIRCSPALSPETPLGLIRKVWFDIQLCLARRSRNAMTMKCFSIKRDGNGNEYVHLGPDRNKHLHDPQKQKSRGLMFSRPGDPLCPVESFKKYISKCPSNATFFFLRPKYDIFEHSEVWYTSTPMSMKTLGGMLKEICKEVGLSRIYTNHSLQSTAVARLLDA